MNMFGVDGRAVKAATVRQSCCGRDVRAGLTTPRPEANPAPADRWLTLRAFVLQ